MSHRHTFHIKTPMYIEYLLPGYQRPWRPPPVIAIIEGRKGYFPLFTRLTPDELNGETLPDDVVESVLASSMFGWDTPASAPAKAWLLAKAQATAQQSNR